MYFYDKQRFTYLKLKNAAKYLSSAILDEAIKDLN